MNGDPLPFTIELGRNWKLWQAYRELYSNCIDERGAVVTDYKEVNQARGEGTIIIVHGLDEIHQQSATFVLRTTPKYVLENVEIHESETPAVFYKGIKVLDLPTKYSYNVLGNMTLTEDRTVSQWEAEYEITKALVTTSNTDCLIEILGITDETFHEAKFNWSYSSPSETFMRLVSKMKERSHTLGTYYGSHEPAFLGKLDRGLLSPAVAKKLNTLRRSVKYQPAEIFVAQMSDDYKIIAEGIVLNVELLANSKKLNFTYRLACHKAEKKLTCSDYQIVIRHMLGDFQFGDSKPKREPQKKAAA